MLDKAAGLGADRLVLDLEDGVAPPEKALARENLRERAGTALIRDGLVRVNPASSPWHDDDLALVEAIDPAGVLLPKCESRDAVAAVAGRLAAGRDFVWPMIETAAGVAAARELAAVDGVAGLVLGSADLRRSLGARPRDGRDWERHALAELLLAARLHGRAAIDSVYFHFRDDDGLRRHAAVARECGYDGKSCIHPAQIAPIHDVFTPDDDEVAWARAVLDAWNEADGGERAGVVVVAGEMIEALHVELARRILSARG